jgi:hypothetical protein
LLLLIPANPAGGALSGWDEIQLELLGQYSTPLRWHNIEGDPHWVSGREIRGQFGGRLHWMHLDPGESVTFRADGSRWLRVTAQAGELSAQDFEASVSTDGRTYAWVRPVKTNDPRSWLVRLPEEPCVARLSRPSDAGSSLTCAAFISVEQPFSTLAPHRETIRLPGKPVSLQHENELGSQRAWPITSEEGIEFSVTGPAQLQLVVCMPWPRSEAPREQAVTMQVEFDGAELGQLLFAPGLDSRHRTRVNGTPQLVSHRLHGYFTVPNGKHLVQVKPDSSVYLSVYRQAPQDFLLPGLNAPVTNTLKALGSALFAPREEPALPLQVPNAPLSSHTFAGQEQAAWRLARDNSSRDTGAQAADALTRISEIRSDYPAARDTAAQIWRQRTAYRELLPVRLTTAQPFQRALFALVDLRPLFEPESPVAVYNPTFEQVEHQLAEGRFLTLPTDPFLPLTYELPARSHDSTLRIAATTSEQARAEFQVQFDDEVPIRIVVEGTNCLPAAALEPSSAMATLHMLQQAAGLRVGASNTVSTGSFDLSAEVCNAGIVELPLRQGIRQVRIFRQERAAPAAVSVAYRAAKPFSPGEATWLAMLDQARPHNLLGLLAGSQEIESSTPESVRQVHNALLPLIRLLKAHAADFTRSIDLTTLLGGDAGAIAQEEAAQLKAAAAKLEAEDRALEAVESWNRLFWLGPVGLRTETVLALMRLLQSLGEDFLAGQYARYVLLKHESAQAIAPAVSLLEANASQEEDTELLEQLRAFMFTRCPCEQHLVKLLEALALNDRDEMVLWAGMVLREGERPYESMLPGALHLNWWQTFDALVTNLPSAELGSFWRGQKHLAFYRFGEAEQEFRSAGGHGVEFLRAVEEGGEIRSRLAAADLSGRAAAVAAWENWQSNHPGPKVWRSAKDVVVESAHTELLFNSELNQFSQVYRAEPNTPVTLRFVGPARLQIEARPVLEPPSEKPVDDWLELAEGGVTNRVPVYQAVPNPSLEFAAGYTNALPARKTTFVQAWGSGRHEVHIRLTERSGLIRVLQEQPVLPARILPPTPGTRTFLSAAGYSNAPGNVLSPERIRQLLDLREPGDLLKHLVTLLRIAEGHPTFREEAQCVAELLAWQASYPPGSRRLLARLANDRVWLPLPVTPLSAGIRPLRVPADLAQDPSARLRRALLVPASTNQLTIGSQNEFAASMTLLHTADVRLQARLVKAGFSPAAPTTLALQIDNQDIRHLSLTPVQPTAESAFTLAPGPHRIRTWITDPVVNQFVRITLHGESPGVTNSIWSALEDAGMDNRFFHTATAEQPLRFAWKGPALFRIDEWREDHFLSELRLVPEGDQTVEIRPTAGRTESWYRVFVRTTQTNQPQPRPTWTPREPDRMPPPVLQMPPSVDVAEAHLTDYYELGRQEDGTWTVGVLGARRRPFEAGGQFNSNEFLEVNGGYRKAATSGTLWFNTEALARVHRPGDITLGLAETIMGRPRTLPFEWAWSAEAFAGWLDSDGAGSDFEAALYSEFKAGQRRHLSRKVDLYPYLSLFGRYLTLDSESAANYDYIDQDLFTDYRDTHRWGARLGTELEYRPWLDTLLQAGLELAGNEDFTPDHCGLRLSWNQMLGPARGEAAYGFNYYLNDSDRSSDAFLQSVSVALFTELWLDGRHRLELGGQYRHDWPASVDSYFLVLRWNFSNGRGYTDYAPDDMVFRNLRNRAIPARFNNRLEPGK